MSRHKVTLTFEGPILSGTISTAKSTCGKPNCACKADPPKLHGTYYRWTGIIDGKRTTKTLSRYTAYQCLARIRNYKKLQRMLDRLIRDGLKNAPWKKT